MFGFSLVIHGKLSKRNNLSGNWMRFPNLFRALFFSVLLCFYEHKPLPVAHPTPVRNKASILALFRANRKIFAKRGTFHTAFFPVTASWINAARYSPSSSIWRA